METEAVEVESIRFSSEEDILKIRMAKMKKSKIIENFECRIWKDGDIVCKGVVYLRILFKYKNTVLETSALVNLDYRTRAVQNDKISVYNANVRSPQLRNFVLTVIANSRKGFAHEVSLLGVLKDMIGEKVSCDGLQYIILKAAKANRFYDNVMKIDFFVQVGVMFGNFSFQQYVFDVPLQCKSSTVGQAMHKTKNPGIPSVVVYDRLPSGIKDVLKDIINHWLMLKSAEMLEKSFLLTGADTAQGRYFQRQNKRIQMIALEKIHQ